MNFAQRARLTAIALTTGIGAGLAAPAAAGDPPPLPTLEAGADGRYVRQALDKVLARPITLDDAVRVALLHNPDMIGAYRELGVAPADLVRSGLFDSPDRPFNLRRDFLGLPLGEGTVPARLPDEQRLGIAQTAAAVAADAIDAYLALAVAEAALPALEQLVEADTAAWELADGQRRAGNLNAYRALPYKVELAQALYDRDLARVHHDNARARLARAMGVSASALPAATAGLPTLPDALPDGAGLRRAAWLNRADARRAEAALRADNPFGAPVPNPRYSDVLPLVAPTRTLRAEARVPKAEIELLAARHRIDAEIGEAEGRLRAAHARAVKLKTLILPVKAEMVDEALKHYNGMFIGVYDLLEAKRDELAKQREYHAAVRDFWAAYFDLERAVGGQLPAAAALKIAYAAPATPAPAPAAGGHGRHH